MIRRCKKCGFILGTRPGLMEVDGVCQSCINHETKKTIDFAARQQWLTEHIHATRNPHGKYDCVVGVSGGKDSHAIVRRLIENHGIRNPLLVTVADIFTPTAAGLHNIANLRKFAKADHWCIQLAQQQERIREDFLNELHPLKYLESHIYATPVDIARKYGIRLCFFGENSTFEYGTGTELEIFHPSRDEHVDVIFMGAIYPYSIADSLQCAREIGFKSLDDFNEWPREGSVENYTQIDSMGYLMQLWTKYVKFGFQRVSDIACRMVREGTLTREQALQMIREKDWVCDTASRRDFCRAIEISEAEFWQAVDRHANLSLVAKGTDGNYHLKEG